MICVSYQQNTDMLMSFQLKQFYKSTYCTTMFCQTSLITGIVSFIQRNDLSHPHENTGHDIVFGA